MFLLSSFNDLSQNVAMAALISVSDLPAATALSIKTSEIYELDESAIKSLVNGTLSFLHISFTLSCVAFNSAPAVDVVAATFASCTYTVAAGIGTATGFGATLIVF